MSFTIVNTLATHIFYPKALMLLFTAALVLVWAGFFCFSLSRRFGAKSLKSYGYYISYSLGLFVWILSNAYFHTGYLVELGEKVAVTMAIIANLSALFAFASAYQFTVKLKCYYTRIPTPLFQRMIAAMAFVLGMYWNLSPNMTIQGAAVIAPSHFTLHFGEYTMPFFMGIVILITLTFVNLFSIRLNESRVRRTRINYMILGMTIFMCSTAVIQLGFTYFLEDFSLTWLPPALSISEMLFMGYAILASRFYSFKHLLKVTIATALTGLCFTVGLILLKDSITLTRASLFITTIIIGITWPLVYKYAKGVANCLVYGSRFSPADKIMRLEEQFQHSPSLAVNKLARYLGVPCNELKLLDGYQGAQSYRRYFEHHTAPLVLDELEDELERSSTKELSDLHTRMHETNYALVLPLYEVNNRLSHVLVSSHKPNGNNFSFEELMALSHVLRKAQVHINYDQRLRQTQALANSIAHEMRNPLAQVQLEFEHLNNKLADDAPLQALTLHVEQGRSAIARGRQLIDIILREVNNSSLEKEPVELISIKNALDTAISSYGFESDIDANKINVSIEHNFMVKINETLFNFVMFNILRNAIYYFDSFPESRIEIRTHGNEDENRVTIRDFGPGIPPEIRDRIFDDFFSHNKSGGSGLGLGYCQRVMNSFGGSIRCHSLYGKYSEFTLSFPLSNIALSAIDTTPANTASSLRAHSHPSPVTFKKRNSKLILVVDDKEVQRTLVKLYLDQLGYDVVLANNGKVAIDIIHNNPIDLVFMDIQMPVMDGFEAAAIIKSSYPAIPIIALSGESAEEDIIKMHQLMDGRLSKPASKESMKNILKQSFDSKAACMNN